MRSALVLLVALTACKSAESPEPELPREEVEPATTVAADLPAETPLEQVLELPAEATPAMIERRLDRALELLDAMFETIVEHADDCERMATSLERFVEVNRVMVEQVKKLEQHRDLVQGRFKPKLDAWIQKWVPKISDGLGKCFSNPRVTKVFKSFESGQ